MSDEITLKAFLGITAPANYKLHVATRSPSGTNPLDAFARSWEEWVGWNRYRGEKDVFNRDYIFSIIQDYHASDEWLFGGVFKVLKRNEDRYDVELAAQYHEYVGRLKIRFAGTGARGRSFRFENYIDEMIASELLKKPYDAEPFPGLESINIGYAALKNIFDKNVPDWKAVLENLKGVYLLMDTSNGKMYVGSATGTNGIWSRWSSYIYNGHGGNDELVTLVKDKGFDHIQMHFKFSLLEPYRPGGDDMVILERESYWKNVLLTRTFGYNAN